ncbi:sigma-54-dependent Fis family transcriptional regulator [Spartinivicinus ruber]|uniref:sigma-54-dependent Fis family transcriptional regulator n=1 Tax=Spartinivicinus ruber TaxID=2683272 RepID=UPI0013D1E2CF|nr:sigma 54-interacting transcriptional regulator [Spartinivicinus ruber]
MQYHQTQLQALLASTAAFATEQNINVLLKKIVIHAGEVISAEGAAIFMLDVTKTYLNLKVAKWQDKLQEVNETEGIPLQSVGQFNTENICVFAALTGKPQLIDDVYTGFTGFDFSAIYDQDKRYGTKTHSLMVVPLRDHEEKTLGVLLLANASNQQGESASFVAMKALALSFAAHAAVALNNAYLIDANKKLINLLGETNQQLEEENKNLKQNRKRLNSYQIIGESKAMQQVYALMDKVVTSPVNVLLRGETGTGKEVFARAIHNNSERSDKPFITQNCAAVPEQLLESELFGYKKGSFTGANTDKKGLFDEANGGTLFLDEIGDMPLNLQAKLLRALQEGEVRPLGATKSHKVDVRIIAATHCNLEEKITAGSFREDLYYRLSVFPIFLPALRERGDDVLVLAKHFIKLYAKTYANPTARLAPSTVEILKNYSFPGNVRQLQNIIERAVLLADTGTAILPEHLPEQVCNPEPEQPVIEQFSLENLPIKKSLKEAVQDYEIALIERYLQANNWNQTRTAEVLNMPRRTLVEKINRYKIATKGKRGG